MYRAHPVGGLFFWVGGGSEWPAGQGARMRCWVGTENLVVGWLCGAISVVKSLCLRGQVVELNDKIAGHAEFKT